MVRQSSRCAPLIVTILAVMLVAPFGWCVENPSDQSDTAVETTTEKEATTPEASHEPDGTSGADESSMHKTDAAEGHTADDEFEDVPKELAVADEDTLDVMCEDIIKEALEMDAEDAEEKVVDDDYAEKVDLNASEYQEKGDLAEGIEQEEHAEAEKAAGDGGGAHETEPPQVVADAHPEKDHADESPDMVEEKGGALADEGAHEDDASEKPGTVYRPAPRPVVTYRPSVSTYRPAVSSYRPTVSSYRPMVPRTVSSSVSNTLRSGYSGGYRPSYVSRSPRPVARSSFTRWARAGYPGGTRTPAYRNMVRYTDNRIRGGNRGNLSRRIQSARARSQNRTAGRNRPITITPNRTRRNNTTSRNPIFSNPGSKRLRFCPRASACRSVTTNARRSADATRSIFTPLR